MCRSPRAPRPVRLSGADSVDGMVRILLVDDQALVRAGFETILASEPGFEVIGQARDGAEGVRARTWSAGRAAKSGEV